MDNRIFRNSHNVGNIGINFVTKAKKLPPVELDLMITGSIVEYLSYLLSETFRLLHSHVLLLLGE